jgi:hypothetical protein
MDARRSHSVAEAQAEQEATLKHKETQAGKSGGMPSGLAGYDGRENPVR